MSARAHNGSPGSRPGESPRARNSRPEHRAGTDNQLVPKRARADALDMEPSETLADLIRRMLDPVDLSSNEASVRARKWVYALMCKFGFDPNTAEDLTQDVMIVISRRWENFDPARAKAERRV